MLRILGRTSSINVRKVLWTCHEIGLDYEREDWGRGFTPTSLPEFMALNPNGLIPVLADGETVLWESNAICRYLAAQNGREDLLPADVTCRAKVEMWMEWQISDLNPSFTYAFHALSRNSPDHQNPERIAESLSKWKKYMLILEQSIGDAYLLGETFTLADIVVGLSIQRWLLTPFEKPVLPKVEAYYQRLTKRQAYIGHASAGIP